MSTQVITPNQEQAAEQPVFNAKAHIEARMQGKPAPKPEAPKAAEEANPEPVKPAEPEAPRKADTTRSQRRAMRAAEERTANLVLKVLGESGVLPKKEAAAEAAPVEPKRADFPAGDEGTAQFLRATQKFDKEQETAKAAEQTEEQEAARERYQELDAKTKADIEAHFPDWDALSKEWAANEEIQAVSFKDIPVITGLLANSDLRAAVSYHWMKNPDEFLDLIEKPGNEQIRYFHRLEGRLEKEYASTQKAAQAAEPEKGKEDRKHLAEAAKPGDTAGAGKEAPKPKPSSEVAARGGSPAPDGPEIGSAAWMALRNERMYGGRKNR